MKREQKGASRRSELRGKWKGIKKIAAIVAMIGVLSTSMSAFAADDYVVNSGDYLKKIAKQVYGDEAKWELIYEANKDIIKNPNLIYKGQVLTIPDAGQLPVQAADVAVPAPATDAAADTAIPTDAVPAPASDASQAYKNVPVGNNPVRDYGGYTYTSISGSIISFSANDYVAETQDSYGVTYREYRKGANEIVMKKVADFIAQNPNSNFASMVTSHGNRFVIITSSEALYFDNEEYGWGGEIIDCEPDDCLYMFIEGIYLDLIADGYVDETFIDEMFDSVSNNITMN
ncbi:MAG: LysM peptidoglycan-binding domain-containing protein [Butyrivibrio sp.]|nr:LysM peptidoglycan-binding domain-containing protein [Butyrivibrio sp.]